VFTTQVGEVGLDAPALLPRQPLPDGQVVTDIGKPGKRSVGE
jgi:hypothetical protein